ncbi:MAG: alpha-mannosidase [Clostridia bacterium]|nr:alpha-mannosidase [Clostridia bacterium]
MAFYDEKIRLTWQRLNQFANTKLYDLEGVEYVKCDYKTDNTFPESGWQPFEKGTIMTGRDAHYWLRASFKTPPKKDNTSYYIKCTTGFEGQWDATNPQGLIYLNGEMVQGIDTNHTEVYLEPDTEYTMHNYFYLGLDKGEVSLNMAMYELDELSEQLYYDIRVPYDVFMMHYQNEDAHEIITPILEQCCNLIDLRKPRSDEYKQSVKTAIKFMKDEFYDKVCTPEGKPIVDCIAHTHIDIEWLWTRAQTREKIQRSFTNALALMKKYPEFKFMLSQPELYRYLKEEAPEKYEELKQLVKEGRWEPEGAMYVEADCNLASGESLVRQIYQGKKFFYDEFGVDCKTLFLPDVFGYSAALPQILKKSGIRHFVTSKIAWNETNTMPVDTFMWEGLDGSEIFTNFITAQDYKGITPQRYTTYVGRLNASEIKGTWNKFIEKQYCTHALTTYGFGDGGGGPTKEMLENQRRLSRGIPGMPVTKLPTLIEHLDQKREEFDASCRKLRRTPRWVGELYLEFHRGTYTSMAKNKRGNRISEMALGKAESLSYLGLLLGSEYDQNGLYNNWNRVLHNQFHDIIPGSSIKEVYDGTDIDYKEIAEYTNNVINEKLDIIGKNIKTDGGLLIYNPSGFARKGMAQIGGKTVELTESIAPYGYKVVKDYKVDTDVIVNGLTAENKFYKITFDNAGRITELFDKTANRQVLKSGEFANEFQAFEDIPRVYENWELTDYYKEKKWVLDDVAQITPITNGSRAGFKIVKKYLDSTICQNIWLYSDSSRIDFDTELDWHEHHQVLKVAFPVDVHTNSAIYETQFGHIERPTHLNTSWDAAKFEVCAHKWMTVAENGYGVALLNDCKYGFNTEGSTMKLTVLKCSQYPNAEADQGEHKLTYSIMAYEGDFREAGVINEAYALNQPLTVAAVEANDGALDDNFSLVSCDKQNVIVETVKKAEADDGMIVRLYDAFNRRTKARVDVCDGFKAAYLCDLMENELEKLEFDGNSVTIPVNNFEIVTLKFVR